MNYRRALFCLAFALASLARTASAADAPTPFEEWQLMRQIVPRHYVCRRTSQPIKVDGKLDELAWQNAPWTENFVDIEGVNQVTPRYRTRAKMLWDDDYLYIAAELEEPNVWATLTKHDSVIFNDPDFEVFINPDGNSHNYYEFEMNALNTGWDLRLEKPYKDGGSPIDSWDIPGLKTAVQVRGTINHPGDTDEGWTIEIAFPWKALKEFAEVAAPPNAGDTWRIDFSRVEWDVTVKDGKYVKEPGKRENNWVWSPQGVIDMHRPEQWGYVQFSGRESGALGFIPDPSLPARRALQGVYYAQRTFRGRSGRWAKDLEELARETGWRQVAVPVEMQVDARDYTATARAPGYNGATETWHIRSDARVWMQ